jgi:hypothetical protein
MERLTVPMPKTGIEAPLAIMMNLPVTLVYVMK